MRLKKPLAILFAVCFAFSAMAMAASAASDVTVAGTTYTLISPQKVTVTGENVQVDDRAKDTAVLCDGKLSRELTLFDQAGLVMLKNLAVVQPYPAKIEPEDIPVASFEMDFGSEVSFDTAYIGIYLQQAGMGEADENCVTIETSTDGKTWAPVGDGKFYYSFPRTKDFETKLPNNGNGWPCIGDVAVPLGETVKARYVRYSFKFGVIPTEPKKFYWTWETNVYEFMAFTEMGVANYKSGRKQKQLTKEDVSNYPVIGGDWFVDLGEQLEVWTISDNGDMKITKKTYDKAAYLADATVEPTETNEDLSYYVQDQTTFLLFEDGAYDEYAYAVGTDGNLSLTLDGDETLLLTADNFKKANGSTSSGASSGTSSATSSATSSDASSAASSATSSAASSAASSATSSTTSSSKAPAGSSAASSAGDGSGSTTMWWIIIAVVAAVVIVAAVVVIVVVRKKKQ